MVRTFPDSHAEADPCFREETRALLHRRVRFGIFLAIGFFVLVAPLDWALGANVPVSLACRTVAVLALLALLALARSPVARARPEWLAAGVVTVLGGAIAWFLSRSAGPGDPSAALHAGGLVLLVLGTGSLVPVGGGFVAVLGMIPLGLQVLATAQFPFPANLALLFGTAGAIVIGAFAAQASARLRREEFEARREREELLRTRTDFVAMLTHDLKNPLGAIERARSFHREVGGRLPRRPRFGREPLRRTRGPLHHLASACPSRIRGRRKTRPSSMSGHRYTGNSEERDGRRGHEKPETRHDFSGGGGGADGVRVPGRRIGSVRHSPPSLKQTQPQRIQPTNAQASQSAQASIARR